MGHARRGLGGRAAQAERALNAPGRSVMSLPGTAAGDRVLIVLLTTLALMVRWKIAMNGGLWRDEALFLFVARMPSWHQMLDVLRFHESHPPLFYFLMRLWLAIAGDGSASIMSLPVFIGVALIPAMFLAGKSLYSREAGLIAAALAAISPPLSDHSALARPYSLLPLLVLAASWLLVVAVGKGGWRAWAAYATAILALVFTHNWAFLVVAGHAAGVMGLIMFDARRRPRLAQQAAGAYALCAALYLPWASTLLFQFRNAGNTSLDSSGMLDWLNNLGFAAWVLLRSTLIGGADDSGRIIIGIASIVAAGLFIVGVFRARGKASRLKEQDPESLEADLRARPATFLFVVTVITAMLLAVLLSGHSNLLVGRCVVMLAPLVLLLVAQLIAKQWRIHERQPGIAWIAGSIALLVVANYTAGLSRLIHQPRSNAREVAVALGSQTRSDDLVIVAPGWLASSFNYYYAPGAEQIDFPSSVRQDAFDFAEVWERMAAPVNLQRVLSRIDTARASGKRIWLVTEADYLKRLTPREMDQAMYRDDYYLMGLLRLSQIHYALRQDYGSPQYEIRIEGPLPRYERLTALLFSQDVRGRPR